MTKIKVEHDSTNGNINNKILQVHTASIDLGFELHKKRYPALRLITTQRPYFIIGLASETMESLCKIIGETEELVIPHCAFDRSLVKNEEVAPLLKGFTLQDYFTYFPLDTYQETDAFDIFLDFEIKGLLRNNFSPVWRKNHKNIVSLWARTLPTPQKPLTISKYQYFEQIFQNSHPIDYRISFWMWRK